jgi:hypothetical protein
MPPPWSTRVYRAGVQMQQPSRRRALAVTPFVAIVGVGVWYLWGAGVPQVAKAQNDAATKYRQLHTETFPESRVCYHHVSISASKSDPIYQAEQSIVSLQRFVVAENQKRGEAWLYAPSPDWNSDPYGTGELAGFARINSATSTAAVGARTDAEEALIVALLETHLKTLELPHVNFGVRMRVNDGRTDDVYSTECTKMGAKTVCRSYGLVDVVSVDEFVEDGKGRVVRSSTYAHVEAGRVISGSTDKVLLDPNKGRRLQVETRSECNYGDHFDRFGMLRLVDDVLQRSPVALSTSPYLTKEQPAAQRSQPYSATIRRESATEHTYDGACGVAWFGRRIRAPVSLQLTTPPGDAASTHVDLTIDVWEDSPNSSPRRLSSAPKSVRLKVAHVPSLKRTVVHSKVQHALRSTFYRIGTFTSGATASLVVTAAVEVSAEGVTVTTRLAIDDAAQEHPSPRNATWLDGVETKLTMHTKGVIGGRRVFVPFSTGEPRDEQFGDLFTAVFDDDDAVGAVAVWANGRSRSDAEGGTAMECEVSDSAAQSVVVVRENRPANRTTPIYLVVSGADGTVDRNARLVDVDYASNQVTVETDATSELQHQDTVRTVQSYLWATRASTRSTLGRYTDERSGKRVVLQQILEARSDGSPEIMSMQISGKDEETTVPVEQYGRTLSFVASFSGDARLASSLTRVGGLSPTTISVSCTGAASSGTDRLTFGHRTVVRGVAGVFTPFEPS